MDIQKEREAHEKHLLSQGVNFKYLPNIQYNELENIYELIEWDEEYREALNEINSSWCTWQARAQAVPEVKNIGKEPQLRVVFEQWAIKASGGWASFSKSHGDVYANDKLQFAWQALQTLAVPEGFVLFQNKEKIELIIRDVAELPDRTSPEDWPEALIVTSVELEEILTQHLSEKCRN